MKHKHLFAVMKHQIARDGHLLNAGDKFPIEFIDTANGIVQIGVLNTYHYDIYEVRPEMVDLLTIEIKSRYSVGDTVALLKHKQRPDHYIPFKISSIIPSRGSFWYQSEWGDQNNAWCGQMEHNIYRLTDEA